MTTEYPKDKRGFTDTAGAAKHLDGIFTEISLRKARHTGRGPAFIKVGASVRYSFLALDRWLASRVRTCTRDPDGPEDRSGDSEAA